MFGWFTKIKKYTYAELDAIVQENLAAQRRHLVEKEQSLEMRENALERALEKLNADNEHKLKLLKEDREFLAKEEARFRDHKATYLLDQLKQLGVFNGRQRF